MNVEVIFDIEKREKEITRLNDIISSSEFWTKYNEEERNRYFNDLKVIKEPVDDFNEILEIFKYIKEIYDLLAIEQSEEMINELKNTLKKLERKLSEFEILQLFSEKYDRNNAICSLQAGAGGTEAQDWVSMLYRMYLRWANIMGFKTSEIYLLEGEEAGIKSVTFKIEGMYAYGYLKSEMGIHRLVRISPFDSSKKRHTSFASFEVLPELSDDINLDINDEDLRIDTYRSSGAGGQHVNKTSSAVRITHLKTGIVVACQAERSQIKNRETALKLLKSKLIHLEEQKKEEEKRKLIRKTRKNRMGKSNKIICISTISNGKRP